MVPFGCGHGADRVLTSLGRDVCRCRLFLKLFIRENFTLFRRVGAKSLICLAGMKRA